MKRIILVAGCMIAAAGQATASESTAQVYTLGYAEFQAVGLMADWGVPADALSRRGRGADDPAGDDHGRHGAGHAMNVLPALPIDLQRRGRGADDPKGDDHGRHGAGHA